MESSKSGQRDPVGLCGIYCGACPLYRASIDGDMKTAQEFFSNRGRKVDDTDACNGCASDVVVAFCQDCEVKNCVTQKPGITHCFNCPDSPCELILNLRKRASDLFDLVANISRIKEIGIGAWLEEQETRWSCPRCHTAVVWQASNCSRCGAELAILK